MTPEQRIELIRRSIEEETGREITVKELPDLIIFESVLEISKEMYEEAKIPKYLLELLPISNDGWEDQPLTVELIEANGFKKLPYHLWHDRTDAYCNEAWDYGDSAIICRKDENNNFMLAANTDRGYMAITKPLNTLHEIRAAFNIVPTYFDFKGSPPTNI